MPLDGLVAEMVLHDSAEDLASSHLDKPYYELRYDFVLGPAETELDREAA